jgi:hypothetical protein
MRMDFKVKRRAGSRVSKDCRDAFGRVAGRVSGYYFQNVELTCAAYRLAGFYIEVEQ